MNGLDGYFVKLYSYWFDESNYYLALEKCPMGSLNSIINISIQENIPFEFEEILFFMREILRIIVKLHEKDIIHREYYIIKLVLNLIIFYLIKI